MYLVSATSLVVVYSALDIQIHNFVIIAIADTLANKGARRSVSTVMTAQLFLFPS